MSTFDPWLVATIIDTHAANGFVWDMGGLHDFPLVVVFERPGLGRSDVYVAPATRPRVCTRGRLGDRNRQVELWELGN